MLSIRDDLPENIESQFIRDQTRKTLRDPAATAFSSAIRAATLRAPRHTPSGIYLGDAMALRVDAARITRTAERIVRGLFGKLFGYPLPQDYVLTVSLLDLQRDMSALNNPEVRELLMLLGEHGTHRAFGKAFDVWYAKADDDDHSSMWVVRLHSAFGFIGFTEPRM